MTAAPRFALSHRCRVMQHDRCNGYLCPCRCKHPSALNARAAKAIALHAGGTDQRELLDMLGIIDGPAGTVILPDHVGTLRLHDLGKVPGKNGDERIRHGYEPDEPPPRNATTPPGLRALPPPPGPPPKPARRKRASAPLPPPKPAPAPVAPEPAPESPPARQPSPRPKRTLRTWTEQEAAAAVRELAAAGMKPPEIADALGISLGAARRHQRGAR